MTDEEKFQAERRSGIGGSDMGDLLELDEYGGCQKRLWFRKTGTDPLLEVSDSMRRHAKRGTKLQQIIGEEYQEITGRQLVPLFDMIRHPKYHFLIHHPDFYWYEPGGSLVPSMLEVKCPSYGVFRQIKREGLKLGWVAQSQQGQLIGKEYGIHGGAFAVMHVDSWTLIHFDVEPDEELQAMILEAAIKFWPLVENHEEPHGFDSSDIRCLKCLYRIQCHGDRILSAADERPTEYLLAPELTYEVEDVLECEALEAEAKQLREQAEQRLRQAMSTQTKIRIPGAAVSISTYPRTTWDTAALDAYVAKYPSVAAMFSKYKRTTIVNAMRVFRC
jgi:hypothetical protein